MQQDIDAVLIGFSAEAHVNEAVSVLGEPPLSKETLQTIETLYGERPFSG